MKVTAELLNYLNYRTTNVFMQETLKEIRLALFARRNGVVADALKASGDSHELIMGCPLSDIIAVAKSFEPSVELAEALWADRKHRESRLMATMLYPTDRCEQETALRWCHDVMTEEEADVLCHRLLRRLEYAPALMMQLLDETSPQVHCIVYRKMLNLVVSQRNLHEEPSPLLRYTAFRLMMNLVVMRRIELDPELRLTVELELNGNTSHSMQQLLKSLLED